MSDRKRVKFYLVAMRNEIIVIERKFRKKNEDLRDSSPECAASNGHEFEEMSG